MKWTGGAAVGAMTLGLLGCKQATVSSEETSRKVASLEASSAPADSEKKAAVQVSTMAAQRAARWCGSAKPENCAGACEDCGLCAGDEKRCSASTDADCRCSRFCKDWGYCSAVDGFCQAKTDKDCANTSACRQSGVCKASHGECVAPEKPNCRYACEVFGHCGVNDERECVPTKKGCAESAACRAYGNCVLEDGLCTSCDEGDPDCKKVKSNPDYWEAKGFSGMHWATPPPDIGRKDGLGVWCGFYSWPEIREDGEVVPGTTAFP